MSTIGANKPQFTTVPSRVETSAPAGVSAPVAPQSQPVAPEARADAFGQGPSAGTWRPDASAGSAPKASPLATRINMMTTADMVDWALTLEGARELKKTHIDAETAQKVAEEMDKAFPRRVAERERDRELAVELAGKPIGDTVEAYLERVDEFNAQSLLEKMHTDPFSKTVEERFIEETREWMKKHPAGPGEPTLYPWETLRSFQW